MCRIITTAEISELSEKLPELQSTLSNWISILQTFPLIESSIEIDEDHDLSGYGVSLLIFDGNQIIDEAYNAYPGIAAIKVGFLPIAACESGSGNPYFLKENSIFRILHDGITDQDELSDDATELVMHLEDLLTMA